MSREIPLNLSPNLSQFLSSISLQKKIYAYKQTTSTVNAAFSQYSNLFQSLSIPNVIQILLLEGNIMWLRKDSLKSYHFYHFLARITIDNSFSFRRELFYLQTKYLLTTFILNFICIPRYFNKLRCLIPQPPSSILYHVIPIASFILSFVFFIPLFLFSLISLVFIIFVSLFRGIDTSFLLVNLFGLPHTCFIFLFFTCYFYLADRLGNLLPCSLFIPSTPNNPFLRLLVGSINILSLPLDVNCCINKHIFAGVLGHSFDFHSEVSLPSHFTVYHQTSFDTLRSSSCPTSSISLLKPYQPLTSFSPTQEHLPVLFLIILTPYHDINLEILNSLNTIVSDTHFKCLLRPHPLLPLDYAKFCSLPSSQFTLPIDDIRTFISSYSKAFAITSYSSFMFQLREIGFELIWLDNIGFSPLLYHSAINS